MHPKLIIFGSISTLIDTSELQREAFNAAFERAGLDWHWSQQDYQTLLQRPGGSKRVADYAKARGEQVDPDRICVLKTEIFDNLIEQRQPPLRNGVEEIVRFAEENNIALAFASTSSRRNVDATLKCFGHHLSPNMLELVTDGSLVEFEKPSPQIYEFVLEHFNVSAAQAIAIEDTPICLMAAVQADIATIAFPNTNAQDAQFSGAMTVTKTLSASIFALSRETVTA